ncbi:MAG: PD40 domain-containing protein [Verrucomicrobiales bacterium]|nr:PD40 domain-containing protein [Verrucomicrobiales bacterium]
MLTLEPAPSQTAAGHSLEPILSGDGSTLVFTSTADNLVENDDNGSLSDVFAFDFTTATTRLVSVDLEGAAGNRPSRSPAVSRDGRWVVFVSAASDLVVGDTNGVADVFVRDLKDGVTRCVSCTSDGELGNGESGAPTISADGRFVAFESRATNLGTNDVSVAWDVYLKDLVAGTLRRASAPSVHPALRTRPSGDATGAVLSDDGATLAFTSSALNLAPGLVVGAVVVTNDLYFLRPPSTTNQMVDLVTESFLASTDRIASRQPALSADGRYLAALRIGSNTNRAPSGFFRIDLDTGELVRVDAALRTLVPADPSDLVGPLISADGETVIFEVRAPPYVTPSSIPHLPIVYAWEAGSGKTTRVSSGGRRLPDSLDRSDLPWGQLLGASRNGEFVAYRGGNTNEPSGSRTNQIQIRRRSTGELRRVSRRPNGDPWENTSFPSVSFSDDGRRMAFQADDPSCVPDDRNRAWDVLVYDWDADAVQLVSKASAAKPVRTGVGRTTLGRQGQVLSRDGRWLVYASSLDGSLILPDTNRAPDVFVRDLVTGSNRLVSVNADLAATANGPSRDGAISADGRVVAFVSFADNLVTGDTNRQDDVFVRDLERGTTVLASRREDGTFSNRSSRAPVVSPDGHWIAFESDDRLASNDLNDATDVYLYDSLSGKVRLVSETGTGPAPGETFGTVLASKGPVFSPDGQWLVYQTKAYGLPPASLTPGSRVLARHLATWEQESWFPIDPTPALTTQRPGTYPIAVFSADSRFAAVGGLGLVFVSSGRVLLRELASGQTVEVATNAWLGSVAVDGRRMVLRYRPGGDSSGPTQVGLWDRGTGQVRPLSQGTDGAPGNGDSREPWLSSDGRFAVFASRASNLVEGDANGASDIFVLDQTLGTTVRIGGSSLTADPVLGADDRTLVFVSAAREFAAPDLNADLDLFVVRLPGPESDFRVTEIRRGGAGSVTLLWAARDRQTYVVEATGNLESPWQVLATEVRVAGGQATAEDMTAGAADRRFYRIRETPAP